MVVCSVLIIQLVFYFLFFSWVFCFFVRPPGFWDLCYLTSDQTGHLAVKAWSPNQWSPRAFPVSFPSVVQFVSRLAIHLGVASRIALCWELASYATVRTWQPSHLSTHINHCACFVPDTVHPHLGSACVPPVSAGSPLETPYPSSILTFSKSPPVVPTRVPGLDQ